MNAHRTVGLIVAAGQGSRAGAAGPKQFITVAGRPMVTHSHAAMTSHPGIDAVLVVRGAGQEERLRSAIGAICWSVEGGATRRESVRAGLEAIAADGGAARVLIHDAARPFLPHTVIDRLLSALGAGDAAVPVLPVADTIATAGETLGDVVPRETLARVQTPQAFSFDRILAAHRSWPDNAEASDDAQIARAAGIAVAVVAGDRFLEKLTYREDFAAVEASRAMRVRTGLGFDVHRLEPGEELWLGGILIPHDRGLSGHSDADVALHAITDALLGAAAQGDIGSHFPPTDPQWRGTRSDQFLRHAASLVEERGGVIDFIDLTLMCEAPKIGPFRDAMRGRISAILRVEPAQISVKATTTERLGFTGRGEGIAAQAVATIRIAI
ncbi:bifunctional 2-C-methyl-D-erythritol 4-phosphate cytidylyltransferase/2-C-methyl-D-erythritol 2,4-cyclodiphosphate synthase [Stakelama saccharophila]|uniref:Bifunctional enzyme IspD/IspF n=1 Tax=Stakelama saccharophila TaxID=3075605 RepID=A0ABZ0B5Q6_9SPHN|nr:bifunctional 2-C-methyl-D-erythritol 4-phosphate cytidylyltransferase/2-C-methyl-D-erythritol 2,4-cyclodiphosphate synthase [Stakelama sp. W311]WNO52542.1 bifunctional 2-C-methyl-D-erythritol 4-phosphate cytidylyltransferase/2-C-methyl-D-erythritol 2,4-cyclodiphosphate synthase [Stakelama sp. W311]